MGDSGKVFLSPDATFHLNEYEELRQAQKSAQSASRQAVIAIWISIVALCASVVFSAWQVNLSYSQLDLARELAKRPTKLAAEQLQAILDNQKMVLAEMSSLEHVLTQRDKPEVVVPAAPKIESTSLNQ